MENTNAKNEFENLPEGWKRVRLGEVIEENFSGGWGDEPKGNIDIFAVFSTLAIDYNGNIDFNKAVPRKLTHKKLTNSN